MSNIFPIRNDLPYGTLLAAAMETLEDTVLALQNAQDTHPEQVDYFKMKIKRMASQLSLLDKEIDMAHATQALAGKFGRKFYDNH